MLGEDEHQENEKASTDKKQQKTKKKRTDSKERLTFPPCKVCSGNATGIHYGVYTCEPCKVDTCTCNIKNLRWFLCNIFPLNTPYNLDGSYPILST